MSVSSPRSRTSTTSAAKSGKRRADSPTSGGYRRGRDSCPRFRPRATASTSASISSRRASRSRRLTASMARRCSSTFSCDIARPVSRRAWANARVPAGRADGRTAKMPGSNRETEGGGAATYPHCHELPTEMNIPSPPGVGARSRSHRTLELSSSSIPDTPRMPLPMPATQTGRGRGRFAHSETRFQCPPSRNVLPRGARLPLFVRCGRLNTQWRRPVLPRSVLAQLLQHEGEDDDDDDGALNRVHDDAHPRARTSARDRGAKMSTRVVGITHGVCRW